MKKHSDETYCLHTATKEEIFSRFQWYGFKDSYGHPIENCVDFIDLVTAYCECAQENMVRHEETLQ